VKDARSPDLLPVRPGESDEERRLREAINRLAGQMVTTLDHALRLRTAPNEAQKMRHVARGHLVDFAIKAMHAQAIILEARRDSAVPGE
jgi:hypothetical protein